MSERDAAIRGGEANEKSEPVAPKGTTPPRREANRPKDEHETPAPAPPTSGERASRGSTERDPAEQDPGVADELFPLVYDELRGLAGRYMRNERAGHTLHPTELVHEAYFRLADIRRIDWQGRTHFYAMAARQMRRLLVEHARAKSAKKRGARPLQVTFDDAVAVADNDPVDAMDLDRALSRLSELAPRAAQVAEMRLFAGLLVKEIATTLGVTDRTVKSDWRFARTWLTRELSTGGGE